MLFIIILTFNVNANNNFHIYLSQQLLYHVLPFPANNSSFGINFAINLDAPTQ